MGYCVMCEWGVSVWRDRRTRVTHTVANYFLSLDERESTLRQTTSMSMRAHLCGLRGRAPHLAALSLLFRWPRTRSEHLAVWLLVVE